MVFSLLIYVAFTIVLFLISFKISNQFNLKDFPTDNKVHSKPVSYLGGITILISLIFMCYYFMDNSLLLMIFLAGFIISIIFIFDDKISLSPQIRVSIIFVSSIIFISISKIYINNYNFLLIDQLVGLNFFTYLFTTFCILFLLNSFNYFDGIDGIASILFIIFIFNVSFVKFFYNYPYLDNYLILLPFIIFLFFNFSSKYKMFLGNNGSASIGFVMSLILIYLSNNFYIIFPPSLVIWIVAIFVYEFLSINLSRFMKKISILQTGKDHLHYILLNKFSSKILTIIYIVLINQLLFMLGFFLSNYSQALSFIAFIFLFFVYFYIREKNINNNIKTN